MLSFAEHDKDDVSKEISLISRENVTLNLKNLDLTG